LQVQVLSPAPFSFLIFFVGFPDSILITW
jgi:hypothetical protein